MIIIDNKQISDDVVEAQFVCDLAKCKGGCCEDGDAGAPLDKVELPIIVEMYDKIKPYLSQTSINEVERQGHYIYTREFGWVTPTIESDKEICVYATRQKDGMIKCAFEQAYYDGVIAWKKPVSCHLYPITVKKGKYGDYERINYEPRENLCNPACALGKKLRVPVYEFLREPLVRRYGQDFYDALQKVAREKHQEETK
ncbi:MAG TPA: DUF3109 family protein [Chitinophagaceae bacterium]|nr:DUF3109 family protein [Chitinophagaceae bacterium]